MTDPIEPRPLRERLHYLLTGRFPAAETEATARAFRTLGMVLLAGFGAVLLFRYILIPSFEALDVLRQTADALPPEDAERPLLYRFSMLAYLGVFGLALAIWRSYTAERQVRGQQKALAQTDANLRLSEERNTTDAFTKAIELLGARNANDTPNLEQRLGAIYALERIARENVETYHIQIMETLCAYVREHAPAKPGEVFPGSVLRDLEDENRGITDEEVLEDPRFQKALAAIPEDRREDFTPEKLRQARQEMGRLDACLDAWIELCPLPREDIRAVVDVLLRRTEAQRDREQGNAPPDARPAYRLDLRGTCLRRISPAGRAFAHGMLSDAQLEGADLVRARLERADLSGARLERAVLISARLERANLFEARLERADLSGARLERAVLISARLERANLFEARLERAVLIRARLERAHLFKSWLERAVLIRARLERADLSGARLERADLSYSYLAGIAGAEIMLHSANLSAGTNYGGALRFAGFYGATVEPSFFAKTFGDATVTLPSGMKAPPQWLDRPAKTGRCRILRPLARLGRGLSKCPSWSYIAPSGWENVTPLPPPNGASWPGD